MRLGCRDIRRQFMTRSRWKEHSDEAAVARQREARLLAVQADIHREMDRLYPGWDRKGVRLTDAQRTEVLCLRRDHGLTYEQIATRMGCGRYVIAAILRQAGLHSNRFTRFYAARRRRHA
jgi:predicted DNA-binding protein (UPF0251 family)